MWLLNYRLLCSLEISLSGILLDSPWRERRKHSKLYAIFESFCLESTHFSSAYISLTKAKHIAKLDIKGAGEYVKLPLGGVANIFEQEQSLPQEVK